MIIFFRGARIPDGAKILKPFFYKKGGRFLQCSKIAPIFNLEKSFNFPQSFYLIPVICRRANPLGRDSETSPQLAPHIAGGQAPLRPRPNLPSRPRCTGGYVWHHTMRWTSFFLFVLAPYYVQILRILLLLLLRATTTTTILKSSPRGGTADRFYSCGEIFAPICDVNWPLHSHQNRRPGGWHPAKQNRLTPRNSPLTSFSPSHLSQNATSTYATTRVGVPILFVVHYFPSFSTT